jgi:DNA repair exonuclease SbcCD ATPase subunit
MSQIEILQKMLSDMDKNINQLNTFIENKEGMIHSIISRIEELNANLLTEKASLTEAISKREKMIEMQTEVQSNYNQINESVNTLVEILKTKI